MDEQHTDRGHQRGVTLLEVMIALLVLSIGLLGLAALQTTALRYSLMAEMQQRALQQVRDIGERMRANPSAARRGDYLLGRGQTPAGRTPVARADLQAWRRQLAALPAGSGEISTCTRATQPPCAAIDGHIVSVYWNAARDPATHGHHCPPRSAADFSCYRQLIR